MKPEERIRTDLIEYLAGREWLCEITHGSRYQKGFPDLYLMHARHGQRWVDTKVEGKYSFTKAQIDKWPKWELKGVGIWILTGATQEQYDRLFAPPNWRAYWKPRYGQLPDVRALLDDLKADL